MTDRYDDMLHLPHHVSPTRTRMAAIDRAAQFLPFAALTGHDAAVKETARLTDRRVELDDYEKAVLNAKLQAIAQQQAGPDVALTYFLPDEKKTGGCYVTATGTIKKLDEYEGVVVMTDGAKIPIDAILAIESEGLASAF